MTVYVKPRNPERIRNENLVIGYYKGKAIIRNENDFLHFIECEECHAPEGTIVENEGLTPITELSLQEQGEINSIYGGDGYDGQE